MASYIAQFNDIIRSLRPKGTGEGSRFLPSTPAHAPALGAPVRALDRLVAELTFANQLCSASRGQVDEWRERILEAGRTVQAGLRGRTVDVGALVAQGEALMEPIGRAAKEYTLLCVSHAHIDMNWMWSWPETVAVTHDTFQTMLALLDEYPRFIFSQSQASTYRLIEQYDPAMFEAIRRRVREGRWEVTASQWVEGDKNMASGESISRHLLYAREYFQDRFGLAPEDVQVDFEPDTFGHPATVPSILARGGVRYYYHCRGSHGPHLSWWEGADGSRILAFNDVTWYMCAIEPRIADPLVEFSLTTGLRSMPVLYGVGDHGGGPTRRDLQRLMELNTWPIYPNVETSSLHRFFHLAEEGARADLPVVTGERNFVFTGCYTSQARQKGANRHGENLLFIAEGAATLGKRAAGVVYPHGNLDEAWKHLLFDQFHDILPGSGVRETRHYALGRAQESQAAAGMARSNALRAIGARVNTASLLSPSAGGGTGRSFGAGVGYASGIGGESASSVAQTGEQAFLVYNPLPYPRSEVIEATLWDVALDEGSLVATDDPSLSGGDLNARPVQVLDRGHYWMHDYLTVAFPVEVPALGYRVVCVSDRLAELDLVSEELEDPWEGQGGSWRKILPEDHILENEFLVVGLDPASGGIASLLDKRTGREWVPEGTLSGILQRCLEANEGMTAWVIGQFVAREDLLDGGQLKKVHDGPYVHTYRWTYPLAQASATDTRVELDVILRQGAPRVAYRLRVDWREMGHPEGGIPHLKVRFPLAVRAPAPRYEIPYGSIQRDLFDGQEVPAQRWVDLSEADGSGVTLANASKYGFSLEGNSLNMTLLRASIDPDPLPDLGEHVIEYALVPHGAGWGVGDSTRAGEEMNAPLVVTSCGFHDGDLPGAASFLAIEERNVRLVALKEGQDGASVILRLVEVEGRETEARLSLDPALLPPGAAAQEADTLERPIDSDAVRVVEGAVYVKVPAFGVTTVRIAVQINAED
jgi:alpha-mannosidase